MSEPLTDAYLLECELRARQFSGPSLSHIRGD